MDDVQPGSPGRRTAVMILLGTGVLGLSGLVVLAAVAAVLGAADYAVFGAYWSALFFVVAILFGAQQESTRAVSARRPGSTSLVVFAGSLALVAMLVVIGTSPLWASHAFGHGHAQLAVIVGLGAVGYAVNGVLAGSLAGSAHWRAYSAMLSIEGLSRAGLVLVALVLTDDLDVLAWAVIVAYPLTSLAGALPTWRTLRPHLHVAESLRSLWSRTSQTMVAAAAVAALVNGFPVLMSATSRGTSSEALGAMTLAVMLTRAPLLVPLMAMQSFLIAAYAHGTPWRRIATLVGGTLVAASLLGLLAAVIGPPILERGFGSDFVVPGHVLALLVVSSGGLGAMCMVSPAVIVKGGQTSNAVGWVVAAGIAIALLAVAPGDIETRVPVALLAGPAVGLVWLVLSLARLTTARAGRQD